MSRKKFGKNKFQFIIFQIILTGEIYRLQKITLADSKLTGGEYGGEQESCSIYFRERICR